MRDAVAEARDLIRVVANDRGLPRFALREADRLLPLAASEPQVVWDRLGDVPGERIDEDVPLAALGDLRWWP